MSARDQLARELQRVLAARPDVLESYLFGSWARGEAGATSDVDVAVFLDVESGAAALRGFEIAAQLSAALRRNDVDLVVLNTAPPLLYHRVLRDGTRLSSRDVRATTTREGRALSRYCDYLPQLRKIERAHRARVASGEFGT